MCQQLFNNFFLSLYCNSEYPMALLSSQMWEQNQTEVSCSEMQHTALMSCTVVLFLIKQGKKSLKPKEFPQLYWCFCRTGTLVSELISRLKHEDAMV